MTGHLDADTLAEYREGLAGRRQSARIRAHLAGCSPCSALDRDLAEVTTLLAAAPVPRMPDELASRLQGVLAAESASRAALGQPQTPAGAQDAPRPARTARTARNRRVLALRVASATAVVAVLAGVGIALADHQGGSNAIAGGSSPQLGPAVRSSGAGPGNMAPNSTYGPGGRTLPVLHSGRDYQPASLAAQASAVLGGYTAHSNAPVSSPASSGGILPGGGSQQLSGGASQQLTGCVRRVTGSTRPTLVDEARYRGQPATIIVAAPAAGRAGQVWVTGAGCSATHPDVLAHTRLTTAG